MKRREILLGIGAVTSIGLARQARFPPPDHIEVKIWVTEEAASYPEVLGTASGYIGRALRATGIAVDLTMGETPVPLSSKDDLHLRKVIWPRTVLEGVVGIGDIDPVRDVNLLITDGPVTGQSAGYAKETVAAVAGARHLAEMTLVDRTPPVVDYTVPAAIIQLLLHECGHALGLGHDHGTVAIEEATATVSPMVSGYAWASESVRRRQLNVKSNACGDPLRVVADQRRRLSMRFSACAASAIHEYRRKLLP